MSHLHLFFDGKAVTTISVDSELGKAHFRGVSPDARFLSDRQFRVCLQGGTWMLEHLATATNETLCEGKYVPGAIVLRTGMTISVGNSAKGVSKFPLLVAIKPSPEETEHSASRSTPLELPASEGLLPPNAEIPTPVDATIKEVARSATDSPVDWAGAAAIALDVLGALIGSSAGGRTVVHEGRSTMGPIILTIDDRRVYRGNGTLGEVVATIEDRKIYRGRSTIFGEVVAHVDGDRVIAGSSAWGDVIARIDGNRVISGASTWGDVIATVENGGHMAAGAAAACFLLI